VRKLEEKGGGEDERIETVIHLKEKAENPKNGPGTKRLNRYVPREGKDGRDITHSEFLLFR